MSLVNNQKLWSVVAIASMGSIAVATCWKNGPWELCAPAPATRTCISPNGGLQNCSDTQSPALGFAIREAVEAFVGEQGKVGTEAILFGVAVRTERACPAIWGQPCVDVISFTITCAGSEPIGAVCDGEVVEP